MKKIASLSNVLAGALVLPSLFLAVLPAAANEVAAEVEKGFWDREKLTATCTAETLGNPSDGINRRALGWPAIHAANTPSGGGGYPLADTGTRLKVKPTEEISLTAAVFSGNDAQKRDRSCTDFSFDSPPVWFGEAAYSINQDKDSPGIPATFKL
ncbi:hypothetical protein WV31_01755 [Magnetospirillum sp. ME-1]|uniref:Uncharacterized protein n=1 Tax=Paramagnetospirillum magneticum (strain ATCC 700264 / AMB-1) TaxID=342108 RepID=Q2W8J9_PARM1|nr:MULTISPECIES: carbohydrate porin [Rhodospirillales]ARJ64504.1 hypothetical protein WV31_01755 [Magnetospirillum sp. ME-1]BAE49826.1 hypothetical protein amb1022 [Paramagnetospirillum magneticum AMB-1]